MRKLPAKAGQSQRGQSQRGRNDRGRNERGRSRAGQTEPAGRRKTVAVVVAAGFSPFEFGIACEVFCFDRSDLGVPWYRSKVCAVGPNPILSQAGFAVDAPSDMRFLARADTIVVPPLSSQPDIPPELLDVLRRAHARGARIVSMCTGAFVLGAAGLLAGRRVTTHWMHTEELAMRFPDVVLDPGVLYVDEGDILTSAGSAAAMDLCLHIVRLDFGADVAAQVARRMVVPPHRDGGQAQFIETPVPTVAQSGDGFASSLEWAQARLGDRLTVEMLASQAAMSPRSFARHFQARTGTTPRQWLVRQRVLMARQLLETTDLPVDVIATRCGLGSSANLRLLFQRVLHTSPSAYRRVFRKDEAAAGSGRRAS